MVFTVRLILVVTLLLAACTSVPASQHRSLREALKTAPNKTSSDANNFKNISNTIDSKRQIDVSETKNTTPEPKPKTETNSLKNISNDTNAARRTKNRGNTKYFTTTTEKSTPQPNVKRNSKTTTESPPITSSPPPNLKTNNDTQTSPEETPQNIEKPQSSNTFEFTTKRGDVGRSLTMNIEKYISPEFHNQNNVYTLALSPETKKYINLNKDFKTSSLRPTERTGPLDVNTDLTTPKNLFFDQKYQNIKDEVSESLAGVDEMFQRGHDSENETGKIVKEDLTRLNDSKADIDYKKFRHLEASESKNRNKIHRDYLSEKGIHLDLVSSYNDTKTIDDSISEGLNKIPATGSGVQYKESGPETLPDLDNQESKKIIHDIAENPYLPIMKKLPNKTDAEISQLTNKIEPEFTKSTQSMLAKIDPVTADSEYEKNSKDNAINIFKRGSTKITDSSVTPPKEIVEVTSVLPDDKSRSVTTIAPQLSTSHEENSINIIEKGPPKLSKLPETTTQLQTRESKNNVINSFVEKSEKKANFNPSQVKDTSSTSSMNKEISTYQQELASVKSTTVSPTLETEDDTVQDSIINVIKRGSTKMAEVKSDREYLEGPTITPVTMKTRTVTDDQPNEILVVTKKELANLESTSTEISTTSDVSSIETTTDDLSTISDFSMPELSTTLATSEEQNESTPTTMSQSDTTDDYSTTTELPESTETETTVERVESTSSKSTFLYNVEHFTTNDNVKYFAASTEITLYEATTLNIVNLDIVTNGSAEDTFGFNKTEDHEIDSSTDVSQEHASNLTENDIIKQNEIYTEKNTKTIHHNSSSAHDGSMNEVKDIHDGEEDLNPDDNEDDYGEIPSKKVNHNNSDMGDLEGDGEHVIVDKSTNTLGVNTTTHGSTTTSPVLQVNTTINLLLEEDVETTTIGDNLGLTGPIEEDNGGKIAAIVISSVGAVCLLLLAGLLVVMRKRQKRFNYGQRCRPVSLDAYSMDNVSICNTVGRRKGALRASKRSYGNPAFDDPASVTHPLNFSGLAKFANNFDEIKAEFEEIPQVTTRTNELPEGCEVKNRYANVIPLPETRVFLNFIDGYPNSDYINANYLRGAKGARNYYIACQAPMQNTIEDFWRMIWEQQSKVILMLTNLFESGVEKCADYLPPSEVLDCHRLFGDYQVTLKKREVKDKYIISSLQLKNMVSNSWREVTHLWYLEWPEKGVPDEANSLIAFLIEARSYMKTASAASDNKQVKDGGDSNALELSPVVVHCSPGTGRTGTVIGCDIAIREFELSRLVDIPKIVYKIRRDRASSVQTREQYTFIYKVINLYATKLTGGALDSI